MEKNEIILFLEKMSLKQFQKPQNLSSKSIWNPTAGVEDTQKYAFCVNWQWD